MLILTRKDLREAVHAAVGGAVAIGFAFYFRSKIEFYLGHTLTDWLLPIIAVLYVLSLVPVLSGWLSIRDWERLEREQKAADEAERARWEREEWLDQAEYDALTNWAKQNPAAAERLMSIIEDELIIAPEYPTWIRERRRTEGPNPLTDLPRLFEWLNSTSRSSNRTGRFPGSGSTDPVH
jgi:hypothetical protein